MAVNIKNQSGLEAEKSFVEQKICNLSLGDEVEVMTEHNNSIYFTLLDRQTGEALMRTPVQISPRHVVIIGTQMPEDKLSMLPKVLWNSIILGGRLYYTQRDQLPYGMGGYNASISNIIGLKVNGETIL